MSFSNLRKTSGDLDAMKAKLQSANREQEENFVMGRDPSNQGYSRVRLLPAEDGVNHMITYIKFAFKKGSKAYNNLSRRSIGLSDPCQQYKSALWGAGDVKGSRAIGKKNITKMFVYVYEDKIDPKNNGKILPFYSPQAIRKMVENAINPPEDKFAEEQPKPFNPFDIFGTTGRDLIIRMVDKEGYPNYEQSYFAKESSPWFDEADEAKFEKMYADNVKPLGDLLKEDRFKKYEDLIAELIEVVGIDDPVIQDTFADKIEEFNITSKSRAKPKEDIKRDEKPKPQPKEDEAENPKEGKKSSPKSFNDEAESKKEEKSPTPPTDDDSGDDDDDDDFDGFDFD